jgi:hypothetical protein
VTPSRGWCSASGNGLAGVSCAFARLRRIAGLIPVDERVLLSASVARVCVGLVIRIGPDEECTHQAHFDLMNHAGASVIEIGSGAGRDEGVGHDRFVFRGRRVVGREGLASAIFPCPRSR